MKFATSLLVFYAAVALAGVIDPSPPELELEPLNTTALEDDFSTAEDDFPTLEKRRSCSGNRLSNEVCQGSFLKKRHSYHNCWQRGGHCCARNKNRDYAITVSNGMKHGEDCGYCFSGYCKVEKP